jgi:2-oxoisovalerate dehydrogenase E1 component
MSTAKETTASATQELSVDEVLADYKLVCESREASLLGRKEVFMGKAKFGIFGDGKELAQVAMAKAFRKGDFRSGYYRDMTFMMAIGELTIQEFFAQLYAHPDIEREPSSGGRLMNSHFSTELIDRRTGEFLNLKERYNSASDISPTAGHIPRLIGLGYASKLYRENPELKDMTSFSVNGEEVAFGTIGDASTSEGMFFESVNAAGVLQIPVIFSVWDDGYGISVPSQLHTIKQSISKALSGLQRTEKEKGLEILTVRGWDYEQLIDTYQKASELSRTEHVPCLVHVTEVTQPQGHSTSGSHERYKSEERLNWEKEWDSNRKFREWILKNNITSEEILGQLEKEARQTAKDARNDAWKGFRKEIEQEHKKIISLVNSVAKQSDFTEKINEAKKAFKSTITPMRLDGVKLMKEVLRITRTENTAARRALIDWQRAYARENEERFNSDLFSETPNSALKVPYIAPDYNDDAEEKDGREIMRMFFDAAMSKDPRIFAIGEDVGKIGDVNQGFAGLQEKYGVHRVTDTGIRETTIIGQGVGAALRGLKPITEIQYLDYIFYAMPTLTDDLACLRYRTKGRQTAPMIIRTRGHRLEGVWHSGSPISTILNCLRGIYFLVPRNMVQAAGFYNTMLQSDDPALIIECLNGYRLKEKVPANLGEYTTPLGVPEVLREGSDITIVTYGTMCRIVMTAAESLAEVGISCEVIDVQSLSPFDIDHHILKSVKKTNRVIFADEDVPGGTTAYMMQKVLDLQDAYRYLDSKPVAVSSKEHRPAYASDGDYFSKPSPETVFDAAYALMAEADPGQFPDLY